MKSGKQRRVEIKARRAAKRAAAPKIVKHAARDTGGPRVAVNPSALAPSNSYGEPDFVIRGYYVDLPFGCQECGKEEAWTAAQQKWWYEVARGDVFTTARLCRPCRRRERERRSEARRIHLEGIARKRRSALARKAAPSK